VPFVLLPAPGEPIIGRDLAPERVRAAVQELAR
jgi:hypothetical protein